MQEQQSYKGHLESSKHGIINPQCVDKILSNNTLETLLRDFKTHHITFSVSSR